METNPNPNSHTSLYSWSLCAKKSISHILNGVKLLHNFPNGLHSFLIKKDNMGSFLCVELGGFEFKYLSHVEKQRKIRFTIYSCFKNSAICSTVDDDNSWKIRYPHVFGILLIIYKILDVQSWKLYAFVSCVFLSPGNSVEAHGATCFLFCPTLQGFQTVPQCARRECHSSKLTVRSVPALQSLGDSSCLYLGPLHFLGNSLEMFPSWLLSPAPIFPGLWVMVLLSFASLWSLLR